MHIAVGVGQAWLCAPEAFRRRTGCRVGVPCANSRRRCWWWPRPPWGSSNDDGMGLEAAMDTEENLMQYLVMTREKWLCRHATLVQCLRPKVSKLPHLPDIAGIGLYRHRPGGGRTFQNRPHASNIDECCGTNAYLEVRGVGRSVGRGVRNVLYDGVKQGGGCLMAGKGLIPGRYQPSHLDAAPQCSYLVDALRHPASTHA